MKKFDYRKLDKVYSDLRIDVSTSHTACCGIDEIYGITNTVGLSSKEQAAYLYNALKIVGIVFITDLINNKNCWEATKSIATQGAIAKNPNTGSEISLWTITKAMIPDIFYYDEKNSNKKIKQRPAEAKVSK
jgi:hypothetical protein